MKQEKTGVRLTLVGVTVIYRQVKKLGPHQGKISRVGIKNLRRNRQVVVVAVVQAVVAAAVVVAAAAVVLVGVVILRLNLIVVTVLVIQAVVMTVRLPVQVTKSSISF